MSDVLLERVDDIDRRLHGLERELRDVRSAILADAAAEPVTTVPVPPAPPPRPAPAASPPPRPAATVPPKPTVAPPPARARAVSGYLEEWDLVGARGLALVGGVVTLLGIAFFFVLAANHGWIGPGARVLLGGAASAVVFGAGIVLRNRYGQLHSALAAVGAGIAGAYTTLLAAVAIYDLLPEAAGLPIAAGIAAVAVGIALLWSSEVVAALGLLGAAAVPALHALDGDLTAAPVAFVVLVFGAAALVALRRSWTTLLGATAAATFAQVFWLLLVAAPGDWGAIADTAVFFILLVATALAQQRVSHSGSLDSSSGSLALAGAGLSLIASLTVFDTARDAGIELMVAASVLGVATVVALRVREDLAVLLGALALTVAAVGTADLLSSRSLTIVWAAEAAVLALVGMRLGETRYRIAAVVYSALALVHLLAVEAPLGLLFERTDGYAAAVPGIAAVAIAAALAGWRPVHNVRLAPIWPYVQLTLLSVASLAALDAVSLCVVELSFTTGHLVVTAIWAAAGLAAVVAGGRLGNQVATTAGFTFLAATAVKTLGFDWTELGHTRGAVSLLVVAVPLVFAGVALRVFDGRTEGLTIVSGVCSALAFVGFVVAIDVLVSGDHAAGAALLAPAALFTALAAATFRAPRLRNLTTVLWVHGLLALLGAEAAIIQGRGIVIASAGTAVVMGQLARGLGERRLHAGALVLLGCTTLATIATLTTPDRLVHATENPAVSLWALTACIAAGAALAWCDEPSRSSVGWLSAGMGMYAVSLGILQLAEWISPADVATDFQRGHTAVTAFWGLIGLGLLVAGLLRRTPALRLGGLALFGLGLAKLFLYDLSALSSVTRALSFLAVGAFMLAGGFFLQKLSARLDVGARHTSPSS